MSALVLVVALLAQAEPAVRTVKVRVLVGEKPAPPDTEVRLFNPSPLCGTAQFAGAPMKTPDAEGFVTFAGVEKNASIRAQHRALGHVGLPADRAEPLILRFPTGLPLSGRVVDAKGRPVRRARVKVISREPEFPVRLQAVSDEDGSFQFLNLQAGTWAVSGDAFDEVWSRALEVPAGTAKLEVQLPARVWFSGTVLDGAGQPVVEPWLYVQTVGMGDHTFLDSARDPHDLKAYEALLPHKEPEHFRKAFGGDAKGGFETFAPVDRPMEVWADGPPSACAQTPRALVSTAPIVLRLPAQASLKAKVALPKVKLSFTGPHCEFTADVVPVGGVLVLQNIPAAVTSVELSAPLYQPVEKKLKLSPGQQVDLGVVKFKAGSRLVGRVREGRFVWVFRGSEQIALTDQDGNFDADGLVPGPALIKTEDGRAVKVMLVAGEEARVDL